MTFARVGVFWAVALLLMVLPGAGRAETRVALVIGNASYAHAPRLRNPPNDAATVAAALRKAGFQTVVVKQDLSAEAFKQALYAFSRLARDADVAVVHYSGHGMEKAGVNYLIPVDATLATEADLEFQAIPLDLVLHAVEGAKRLRIVMLDACRDNPFAVTVSRPGVGRGIGRGLAPVEPVGDTLVVYSAKAGSTADDGDGANSPFSAAVAREIGLPGVEINKVFRRVRDDVLRSTNYRQEPFAYGSLSAQDFYFIAPAPGVAEAAPSGEPQAGANPASANPASVELTFWESIKSSNDPADFQAYLGSYPAGAFAPLARNRLTALSRIAPPPAQAPAKPARDPSLRPGTFIGADGWVHRMGEYYPGSDRDFVCENRVCRPLSANAKAAVGD
jgi:uncharacterized caspase-like protein